MCFYRCLFLVFLIAGALGLNCTTRSVLSIKNSFEPSDVVWDVNRQVLWLVSDDGSLLRMTVDGKNKKYWTIFNSADLEGVVLIPGRENYIYVQSEDDALLYEFDVRNEQVVRTIPLNGTNLESITWVQTNSSSQSVLYSGVQKSGKIYVYKMDFNASVVPHLVETFKLPSPNPGDLSALHYEISGKEEHLFALYDTAKLMVLYSRALGDFNTKSWKAKSQWNTEEIGSEGFAWATVNNTNYFFVCVDVNKDARELVRYSANEINSCFNLTSLLPNITDNNTTTTIPSQTTSPSSSPSSAGSKIIIPLLLFLMPFVFIL